jgi:anti-sigma regulatory factor (Ser/Thr protein kinase)
MEAHLGERLDGKLDDAKTVASELVNNAYVHGEGRIELRVSAREIYLLIEVIDQGTNSHLVAVQSESSGSRGLAIVDQLAHRWGTSEGTTHVWAELLIPTAGRTSVT